MGRSARPARVCLLDIGHPGDPPSGVRRVTDQTARALGALGHHVHVVGRATAAGQRPAVRDGVTWHPVPVADAGLPGLERCPARDEIYSAAAKHRAILALHAAAPLDAVVVPQAHGEGLVMAMDPRLPVVTRVMTPMRTVGEQETWLAGHEQVAAVADVEVEALRHVRRIHAASRAVAAEVTGPSTAPERTRIVPLGVTDRAGRVEPLRPEQCDVHVLFVGRLERRKGVDVLLEAARALVAEHPSVSFTLAGPDMARDASGATYREAFLRSAGPDLAARIRFAGSVPDATLWRLYAGADVVCLPSRYESFGNVLIEAMMFGKAIVTCAVGGIPEVVEEGVTAVCAQPGDPASLAARLRAVITDAALRERLGAAGRRRFLERFDLAATAPRTLGAYLELTADHETPPDDEAEPVLRRRLAEALARIARLPEPEAAALAAQLRDGHSVAVDHAGTMAAAWYAPAERFSIEVFANVLGRRPYPSEERAWRAHLDAGGHRGDLLAELLGSTEVQRRGIARDWQPELRARLLAELPARLAAAGGAGELLRVAALAHLGREPRPDELARWSAHLTGGGSPDDVLRELRASEEHAAG